MYQNAGHWAKVGVQLAQTDSTNAELQRQLAAHPHLPEGFSVRADYQTQGKGRLGREWEGAAGQNLALSIYLRDPGLQPADLFALSQNIALGVRTLIETFMGAEQTDEVCVKWPNDVYVGSRKVAGILIETTLKAHGLERAIVGIGINVNQTHFEHAPQATSLALLTDVMLSVAEVSACLLRILEQRHHQLRSLCTTNISLESLRGEYMHHLYGRNRWHRFELRATSQTFAARLHGVNAAGAIRLEHDSGMHSYGLDEVRYVQAMTTLK